MMRKVNKGLLLVIATFLMILIVAAGGTKAYAEEPYKTYTIDGYGHITETQTAYLPYKTITKVGEETLVAPTDFTLTKDNYLYILDSGNQRVVVSTLDGELVATFGEEYLVNPKGMYVTSDHTCYVADRDARSIFVFNQEGKLIQTYGKPDHPLYGDNQDFLPQKIVVNESGTMYIICESNTNGIVQISPVAEGTFLGYFGTNNTNASLWNIIWRSVLTDAQRAKMQGNIPATPDNMAIDEKGLIYTVTRGENEDTLKRLNIAGVNMIEPDAYESVPAAVAVGNHDNAFVVSQMGYIYEYNNEGEMLFVFGGSDNGDQRIGLSTKVEAIQIGDDDKIYVLDSDKAQIQIYEPTEFTNYLHNALYLYSKGRYTESKLPLGEVLEMNNLFDYANMAMGRALIQEENYEEAIKYSRLAKDYDGYSDAFWEIRNLWLKRNLVTLIFIVIGFIVLKQVVSVLDRKLNILKRPKEILKNFGDKKLMKELRYQMYFMKHPIDGCYGIKREGKVSLLSTNIFLLFLMILYIVNKYFCGFLMKTVREGRYDILSDVGFILIVLGLVVGCNYLICTINDGEGKLRHIYSSAIYSMGPALIFVPILLFVSHVVTYNEVFFIQFGYTAMFTWIAVLMFLSIKEINNYTLKETVKIIFLTFFTILIALLLAFIIYVLWSQVFNFIRALIGEVVYRIGS